MPVVADTTLERSICTDTSSTVSFEVTTVRADTDPILDNPKEIYKCDFPGCPRTFVRQDLCTRHRERHDHHGKQSALPPAGNRGPLSPRSSPSDEDVRSPSSPATALFPIPRPMGDGIQQENRGQEVHPGQSFSHDMQPMISHAASDRPRSESHSQMPIAGLSQQAGFPSEGNRRPRGSNHAAMFGDQSATHGSRASISTSLGMSDSVFANVDPRIFDEEALRSSGPRQAATNRHPATESTTGAYSVSILADQPFGDSPVSIRDEFTAWLFDDFGNMQTRHFPMSVQGVLGLSNVSEGFGNQIYTNYFADPALDNAYPDMIQQRSPDSASTGPDLSSDSSLLSPAKRMSLIALMENRFNEGDDPFVRKLREEIFQGNLDAEDHVLSLRSMQHYIGSYWYHFHAQMPILHQPTFSADNTHEYLLLAVMTIGASHLNRAHGRAATDRAVRLAIFIAWHLRWQVFMDNDFHPPAKLWVFQTLLLLEIYEKMNSTRMLHERAHVHYATTINLMRRGTALIETSNHHDSTRMPTTPAEWWSRWITAEATRRAAFAAFFLDAVHATMFGHAAMMVVHEVRLPLPCDDALWSATSAAEVGRVEASLHANGIRPTTFLDGLKKILTGRKVRTTTFGRMILMAGLLSVSWHMHQRDLQISSLGASQTMGLPDGWRNPLTKAFDFWKKDFDENVEHMRRAALPWQKLDAGGGNEDLSKIATVLHHLSHMATYVDIMDCQIFAGAKRLFGRTVTNADYERAKCKIFDWAKGPGARVGVFHALQLLRQVILPLTDGTKSYDARDDYILMRSWALYFSALIVWSYGFAMDGVLRPFPSLVQPMTSPSAPASAMSQSSTHNMLNMAHDGSEFDTDATVRDAHAFLQTVGAVKTPQELESIKEGRNNVVGVLALLEAAFRDSRWELLNEAADRLRNAIMLLRGAGRT